MSLSEVDLEYDTGTHPPDVPAKWLTAVANRTFFLCYDLARTKYDDEYGEYGAFEKLPPEQQGALCAKAMDELVREGYTAVYSKEILDGTIKMQLRYDACDKLRHFWSYDGPEQR